MEHDTLCSCGACRQLDRKHPAEGHQLAMFGNRTQHAPTDGQALASLFELAGKTSVLERSGQRSLVL